MQLGYKIVLDSNKIVIFKGDVFIDKGFVSKGLFKLNVISPSINNFFLILLNQLC